MTPNNDPLKNEMDAEVNICAALSSFFIGTGGKDIGAVASFLGIPGGHNWERQFS